MIGKREMKEHRRAKVPDISRQNEQVSRGLQNETSGTRSSMRRDQTLRLFREMSVLEVYLESAAALMTNSFARGVAASSTNEEELTMPRANARSASCGVHERYRR